MPAPHRTIDRLLVSESGRTPRADARRNVERLVEAARAAVAEVGTEVSAHEIARRAGVGIGTFYRRIPSLRVLLEAVLDEVLDEVTDLAERALRETDPWQGLCLFAAGYVRLRSESCGVSAALGEKREDGLAERLEDIRSRIRVLVERAQDAGQMRSDVPWQDVAFLFAAASTTDRTIGLQAGADQWERNLRVILDGMRFRP